MPTSRKSFEGLSEIERQQLLAAILEAKIRGLTLPQNVTGRGKPLDWKMGSNGYFTSREGKIYDPTDSQAGFVASDARYALFYGSRGSGKTAAGAQKALKKVKLGLSGAVLNPDFENLKNSTWPELKQWIPWDLIVPSQRYRVNEEWEPHKPFTMVFMNGVKMSVKGLKDPDSARGPNINWLWYDEGGRDKTGLSWRLAIASVRIGFQPQAWVTATPAGLYHWMHEFFIREEIPEEVLKILKEEKIDRPMIETFFGTIEDNKDNLDPAFLASMLLAYPKGYLREQEIGGLFVTEGGTLGDRAWFNGKVLEERWQGVDGRVRYWDLAASEKKISTNRKKAQPDKTCGSLVARRSSDWCVEDQTSGYWEWLDIKKAVKQTALNDGPYVKIVFEEEPGSGGKNQVAALENMFKEDADLKGKGYQTDGYRPEGDRVMLANVWFAEAADGHWYMVEGSWNDSFLEKLDGFPIAAHDDEITSVSCARAVMQPARGSKKVDFLHL